MFLSPLSTQSFFHFLFPVYLVTQGINPREHGIKQELVCVFFGACAFSMFVLIVSSVTIFCSLGANKDLHEQSEGDHRQEESCPFG